MCGPSGHVAVDDFVFDLDADADGGRRGPRRSWREVATGRVGDALRSAVGGRLGVSGAGRVTVCGPSQKPGSSFTPCGPRPSAGQHTSPAGMVCACRCGHRADVLPGQARRAGLERSGDREDKRRAPGCDARRDFFDIPPGHDSCHPRWQWRRSVAGRVRHFPHHRPRPSEPLAGSGPATDRSTVSSPRRRFCARGRRPKRRS